MRSFAVLLSWVLMGVQAISFAADSMSGDDATSLKTPMHIEDSDALFKVTLAQNDQQSFQELLAAAMRIELVRLAGNRHILETAESQYFLDNPKLWLKTYGYKPQLVDGVVVGQNIYFEFAEQRLYEQFQKKNLQIWPYAKRPKLLVMMSENFGDTQTQFTEATLDYRSDVDFRAIATELALPIRVPRFSSDWLVPDSELKIALLQEVLQQQQEDYLLVIDIQQSQNEATKIAWTLFNAYLEKLDQQVVTLTTETTIRQVLADKMQALFERFSEPYLNSANVLGQFNLQISGLQRFEDFKKLEDFLQLQKPQFRQVKLLSISEGTAQFDIEYQGEYTSAIDRLQGLTSLTLLENNALIGQAKAQWNQK